MPSRSSPFLGILTSAALAALTLSVFAMNQFAGPEATVLRFLRILEGRERPAARTIVLGNPYEIRFVIDQMRDLLSQSYTYAVLAVQMTDGTAVATVVFLTRRGEMRVPIYLIRMEHGWVIDARNPGWRSR
ncbi:MAG: hypothetical protein D6724_08275 [Armatimonadetes bacterium]|nr:MAG: hypothetical protein D6724_08275 [Armatimonadota bacterium]